jgi:beta-lactamase regulating signal transducer with metallopeptidase domain
MALEWVVLGYAAGAEAIMLLLLTVPGLRRGMISVVRGALKPMMSVVPFCLFLLMDIYWKYETRPTCSDEHACTPSEHLRHQKSIIKSQRNALLIAAALLLYWILFSVTQLVLKLDALQQRLDKLKKRDD